MFQSTVYPRLRLICMAGALILLGWLTGAQSAEAAGIIVGNPASCDLEDAIASANLNLNIDGCIAGTGTDTIVLSSQDYTYTSSNNSTGGKGNNALPAITSHIIISGHGAFITRNVASCPDATASKNFRLFYVASNGDLTLNDLTVENGCASAGQHGGAIYNNGGKLTLLDTRIQANNAQNGGGIASVLGTLVLSGTEVISNTAYEAGDGAFGGGIYNEGGDATLSNVKVVSNTADFGGGIYSTDPGARLSIMAGSLIQHNEADSGGGISNANGQTTLSDTQIISNTARRYGGGGIQNYGVTATLTVTAGSIIRDNVAATTDDFDSHGGGGIHNELGNVMLSGVQLISNSAGTDGGAIFQKDGEVSVTDSCIVDNNDTSVHRDGGTNPLNAENNWWGAANGPSGAGSGSGDPISAGVDADPFLTMPTASGCPAIGGVINGLTGNGLVLQNNGGDDLEFFLDKTAEISSNSFAFRTLPNIGETYNVTVKTQPNSLSQTCTVSNGSGTFTGAKVTNVTVTCTTKFAIGGNVSGLAGSSGLVLQNNGGDDLAVNADGPFEFGATLADGSGYHVTVKTQPGNPPRNCTVSSGTGTLASADVTNVAVTCTDAANGMSSIYLPLIVR